MIDTQAQSDIDLHHFDFTPFFKPGSTIASAEIAASPTGLTEITALRFTSGVVQYVAIDAGLAEAGAVFLVVCQAVSSSGERHTLEKRIRVTAEATGIVAMPPSTSARGVYSADLSQPLIGGNPTAVVLVAKLPAGNPVWTAYATGTIRGRLVGAFKAGKTRVVTSLVPGKVGNESKSAGERIDDDTIEVTVRDFGDNLVDGFSGLGVDVFAYE